MTPEMLITIGLFVWVFVALIWKIADPIIVGISIPTVFYEHLCIGKSHYENRTGRLYWQYDY